MSKKVLSSVLIIILALVLGVSLVACNDTEEPPLNISHHAKRNIGQTR